MTRFTTFTDEELDIMEMAFSTAYDNMSFDTLLLTLKNLVSEIKAEKKCRRGKNEEIERHRILKDGLERLAMNANYGMATSSCDDDEKLIVLCMINKTLKDMQGTLEGMQETLEGMQETLAMVDDKI